jgi:DNA-directed RNA polymerase subunit RPC12/RpoP
MARCPACDQGVRTPSALSLEAWRHLVCPNCRARLELKPRPVGFLLLAVIISFSWLGRLGHTFAMIAEVLMVVAAATLVLLIVVHPQVRLRKKPQPTPHICLNINGPSS